MPHVDRAKRHFGFVAVPLVLLVAFTCAGCIRSPELVYELADETQKLPPGHQAQIRERLTLFFGTPVNPRLRVPSEETNADGEPSLVDAFEPERLQHGAEVFQRHCAGCHGVTGDGKGAAAPYLQPKPRDYRRGAFKFTSTPYGAKPHRNDLLRIIQRGAKGTSMPPFPFLPEEDLQAVVDYVIMLSHRGELERQVAVVAEADYDAEDQIEAVEFTQALQRVHDAWKQAEYQVILPLTAQPKMTDETILAGRRAFLSRGCSKCHGEQGRGQTEWLSHEFIAAQEARPEAEREKINYDVWGQPAPAADLTAGMLHGGRRPIDIYRRIYAGINGTPMPAFEQALAADPETFWHLVHYVLSVVEGRKVEGLENIVAEPVETPAASEG